MGDDATATAQKRAGTLKAIATLRAEARLEAYRADGPAVNHGDLKTELNDNHAAGIDADAAHT